VDQAEDMTPAIAGPDQHSRLGPLARVLGDPPVGQQDRTVVHLDAQITLANDVARLRTGETHPARQDLADQGHRMASRQCGITMASRSPTAIVATDVRAPHESRPTSQKAGAQA
jgi:hypothetical protein